MTLWQQRVIDEQSQVADMYEKTNARLGKLEQFLREPPRGVSITDEERDHLQIQAKAMEKTTQALYEYRQALESRVLRFCK